MQFGVNGAADTIQTTGDQTYNDAFILAADIKLSGQYDRFFWSVSANNLFNALYYDYAIASSFTAGRFSAYPLPGRTYMVRAGATF